MPIAIMNKTQSGLIQEKSVSHSCNGSIKEALVSGWLSSIQNLHSATQAPSSFWLHYSNRTSLSSASSQEKDTKSVKNNNIPAF